MLWARQAASRGVQVLPPTWLCEEVNVVELNASSYRFFVFKVSLQESDGGEAAAVLEAW